MKVLRACIGMVVFVVFGSATAQTTSVADRFIFPVRGISVSASAILQNTSDPRGDGWYVNNDVGSYCQSCYNYPGYHPGEDYNLSGGTDLGQTVFAVGNGIVRYRSDDVGGLGGGLVIEHELPSSSDLSTYRIQGTSTSVVNQSQVYSAYLHLQNIPSGLVVGAEVVIGEPIGEIGNLSTGPHLHFEMRWVQQRNGYVFPPYASVSQGKQWLVDEWGVMHGNQFILDHTASTPTATPEPAQTTFCQGNVSQVSGTNDWTCNQVGLTGPNAQFSDGVPVTSGMRAFKVGDNVRMLGVFSGVQDAGYGICLVAAAWQGLDPGSPSATMLATDQDVGPYTTAESGYTERILFNNGTAYSWPGLSQPLVMRESTATTDSHYYEMLKMKVCIDIMDSMTDQCMSAQACRDLQDTTRYFEETAYVLQSGTDLDLPMIQTMAFNLWTTGYYSYVSTPTYSLSGERLCLSAPVYSTSTGWSCSGVSSAAVGSSAWAAFGVGGIATGQSVTFSVDEYNGSAFVGSYTVPSSAVTVSGGTHYASVQLGNVQAGSNYYEIFVDEGSGRVALGQRLWFGQTGSSGGSGGSEPTVTSTTTLAALSPTLFQEGLIGDVETEIREYNICTGPVRIHPGGGFDAVNCDPPYGFPASNSLIWVGTTLHMSITSRHWNEDWLLVVLKDGQFHADLPFATTSTVPGNNSVWWSGPNGGEHITDVYYGLANVPLNTLGTYEIHFFRRDSLGWQYWPYTPLRNLVVYRPACTYEHYVCTEWSSCQADPNNPGQQALLRTCTAPSSDICSPAVAVPPVESIACPSTSACADGTQEETFGMVGDVVGCAGSVTQPDSPGLCNTAGGWAQCTYYDVLSREANNVAITGQYWLASCSREAVTPGESFTPTNAICDPSITYTQGTTQYQSDWNGNDGLADDHPGNVLGVIMRPRSSCYRPGSGTVPCGNWSSYAVIGEGGSMCCYHGTASPTDGGVSDSGPADSGDTDGGIVDAGTQDAGPVDSGSSGATGIACADGTEEQVFAGGTVIGCVADVTQPESAAVCNLANGWRQCTYSDIVNRGVENAPVSAQYWIASCTREGASTASSFLPTDTICDPSITYAQTGSRLDCDWNSSGAKLDDHPGNLLGVIMRPQSQCCRPGSPSAVCGNWNAYASVGGGGAMCCSP